jgi:adenosylcobalamin-dependent ribonucleoside-triphosphate reductase
MGLSFRLDNAFVAEYVYRNVAWGPIGEYTYNRTYSRALTAVYPRHQELAFLYLGSDYDLRADNYISWSKDKKEQWWLTVTRVVEGAYSIQKDHIKRQKSGWNEKKAQASAQEMFDLIFNFKFTPPGRGLFAMGTPVIEKIGGAALNNCAFVSTKHMLEPGDEVLPFTFLMDMSMLGVGVGFDTEGAGAPVYEPRIDDTWTHTVGDSREGWVAALEILLRGFLQPDGTIPSGWDMSEIEAHHPAGTPISFGGVSSGSGPLVQMLVDIENLLWKRAGSVVSSVDVVDLMNIIGVCVVSGNVRRTAELGLGYADDLDFVQMKDNDLWPQEVRSHRWAANLTVRVSVGDDYTSLGRVKQSMEMPGFFWLDNARSYGRMDNMPDDADAEAEGTNPCSEQTLEDHELCCLVELYVANHDDYFELERTIKFAYLYAKTVTLVPTHNERTNAVMLRNRRIGVSMAGITQAITKFSLGRFRTWLDEGYAYIGRLDIAYSRWLCVPLSIKKTSVKPGGTVPLLCGATPGIHWPESEYYWRVIRFAADSVQLQELVAAGFRAYVLKNEPNTVAVYFPVKEAHFSRSKYNVSMWEQLEIAAMMQAHWSDNQVSATITFKPEEAKDIPYALSLFDTRLKSISFLPLGGGAEYAHAPYQTMTAEEYEAEITRLKPIKATNTDATNDKFCDGDSCTL